MFWLFQVWLWSIGHFKIDKKGSEFRLWLVVVIKQEVLLFFFMWDYPPLVEMIQSDSWKIRQSFKHPTPPTLDDQIDARSKLHNILLICQRQTANLSHNNVRMKLRNCPSQLQILFLVCPGIIAEY